MPKHAQYARGSGVTLAAAHAWGGGLPARLTDPAPVSWVFQALPLRLRTRHTPLFDPVRSAESVRGNCAMQQRAARSCVAGSGGRSAHVARGLLGALSVTLINQVSGQVQATCC